MFSFSTKPKNEEEKNSSKHGRVFVAMSGGVDSSVSAFLLKKEGYDVTGVFMNLWRPGFVHSAQEAERKNAENICKKLEIPFLVFDFEEEQKKEVVDLMVEDYKAGITPNPCVICNKKIKFGKFLRESQKRGADFIATGHYVRKKKLYDGKYQLLKGVDGSKDQSYFLWTLGQEELSKVVFPVGEYEKTEVKKQAIEHGFSVASKKESQEICFLGKLSMEDFLKNIIPDVEEVRKKGDVLNENGEVIGSHEGVIFYTIGQRKGFNITKKTSDTPVYYVVNKDITKNIIVVSKDPRKFTEKKELNKIKLNKTNWVSGIVPKEGGNFEGRLRYRQELKSCKVLNVDDKNKEIIILMDVLNCPPPSGQSLVLYEGDVCIGGGIIK